MDIGCAVGRSTFELATVYEKVLGIDFSAAFVDKCNELKENGQALYSVPGEGELSDRGVAEISKKIVSIIVFLYGLVKVFKQRCTIFTPQIKGYS